MNNYLLRRALLSLPTLFGVTVLIFIAMRVIPGDPISLITSEGGTNYVLSEEEINTVRHSLGLDRPYHEQYLSWMADVFKGDLGRSFWRQEPIRDQILRRAPITGEIAILAIFVSLLIGIPVGILSAVKRNGWQDYVARVFVILFVAVPSFWLALLIVLGGVLIFNWRPSLTIVYPWEDLRRNLEIALGPAFVLGFGIAAITARMTRSATLEVLNEDYVRTARAKGLRERGVIASHVLRNALLPVVTISGLALGGLLGGSVAVERAFGVPGLGGLLVQGFGERDWMLIQNLVLIYGVVFVVINVLIDLTYAVLDPRIAYS